MIDDRGKVFDVIKDDLSEKYKDEGAVKVQLCGRITGDATVDYVKKFSDAKKKLVALGYTVVNPIELCAPLTAEKGAGVKWTDYMAQCIASIDDQYVLAVLPCAAQSDGAIAEIMYAVVVGITPVRIERLPDLKPMKLVNWVEYTKPDRPGKVYVYGDIYNDARGKWEDDTRVYTSSVQSINDDETILKTRNSTYILENKRG